MEGHLSFINAGLKSLRSHGGTRTLGPSPPSLGVSSQRVLLDIDVFQNAGIHLLS